MALRFRLRRLWVVIAVTIIAAPAAALGGWALGLQVAGNVHVVEAGELYRSAQLNGQELDDILDRYHIRTIVNLRGASPGTGWYDDELAMSQKHGLVHLDIPMWATREPNEATIGRLMAALRHAPRPILVHCQSGADRTGLASALYELLVEGQPPAVAGEQLSFRYGHFPWLGSKTVAMDISFKRIVANIGSGPRAGARTTADLR